MTEVKTFVITFYGEISHIVNNKRAAHEIWRGNCQSTEAWPMKRSCQRTDESPETLESN
jgi:hypothetical protein